MKMNLQDPGGKIEARPTMKGCEFGMKKGKGDLKPYTQSGCTKYAMKAKGLEGAVGPGKARGY